MRKASVVAVLSSILVACTVTTEYQRRGVEAPLVGEYSVQELEYPTASAEAIRLDLEARSIEKFSHPDFSLGIVEIDDRGTTNSTQYEQVKNELKKTLDAGDQEQGTLLVVFVHGWHHDCATCDGNLSCFRRLLAELRRRELLPNGYGRAVVGVYIGWRGRAFEGLADYVSIWNRKWLAEDIGHRAGKEVLNDLHALWSKHPRAMMVTIGHSLGGTFLLSAIRGTLTGNAGNLITGRSRFTAVVRAQASRREAGPFVKALRARFGDVVVLMNPAIEAAAYEVFNSDLRGALPNEKGQKYDRHQLPILITIASDADWPNRRLFPAARGIAAVDLLHHFEIWSQKSQLLALGHLDSQVTHKLSYANTRIAPLAPEIVEPKPQPLCTCDVEWQRFAPPPKSAEKYETTMMQLLGAPTASGFSDPNVSLVLNRGRDWDVHSPYIVIATDASMMEDHDDIFNPRLVGVLADIFDAYWYDKKLIGLEKKNGF